MEWLQARFADVSPEAAEDGPPSELADMKAEIMKNKKKIKSVMAMLEWQNKLLTALAITIDPEFQLPDDTEGNRRADDNRRADNEIRVSVVTELESEEPTDPTSIGMATPHSATDALAETGL